MLAQLRDTKLLFVHVFVCFKVLLSSLMVKRVTSLSLFLINVPGVTLWVMLGSLEVLKALILDK